MVSFSGDGWRASVAPGWPVNVLDQDQEPTDVFSLVSVHLHPLLAGRLGSVLADELSSDVPVLLEAIGN